MKRDTIAKSFQATGVWLMDAEVVKQAQAADLAARRAAKQ